MFRFWCYECYSLSRICIKIMKPSYLIYILTHKISCKVKYWMYFVVSRLEFILEMRYSCLRSQEQQILKRNAERSIWCSQNSKFTSLKYVNRCSSILKVKSCELYGIAFQNNVLKMTSFNFFVDLLETNGLYSIRPTLKPIITIRLPIDINRFQNAIYIYM